MTEFQPQAWPPMPEGTPSSPGTAQQAPPPSAGAAAAGQFQPQQAIAPHAQAPTVAAQSAGQQNPGWVTPQPTPVEPSFLVAQVPGLNAAASARPSVQAAPAGLAPSNSLPGAPGSYAPSAPSAPALATPGQASPGFPAGQANGGYSVPAYAPAPYAAGMATPAWSASYAPAKKRKVWPWVVGGIGGLVVLAGAAVFVVAKLGNAAVDAVNPDYAGAPVELGDTATGGGELVVADNAKVAFEIDPTWVDEGSGVFGDTFDGGNVEITFTGAWTAPMDISQQGENLVMVLAGPETIPITTGLLDSEHEVFLSSFEDSLTDLSITTRIGDAETYTTAGGLTGRTSDMQIMVDGVPTMQGTLYTFARGKTLVFVQVLSTQTEGTTDMADIVLDTLRIDK